MRAWVVSATAGCGGQHALRAAGPTRDDEAATPQPAAAALRAPARNPLSQVRAAATGQWPALLTVFFTAFWNIFLLQKINGTYNPPPPPHPHPPKSAKASAWTSTRSDGRGVLGFVHCHWSLKPLEVVKWRVCVCGCCAECVRSAVRQSQAKL